MASSEEAENIVTKFCDTLSSDLEKSLQFISKDCVYQNMPFPAVRGPDGVRDTLAGFFEVTGSVRIEIIEQCAVGNFVMNERLDYFNPPTGKYFALPVAGAFKVEEDFIVEWRDYFCMRQFAEGTGLEF